MSAATVVSEDVALIEVGEGWGVYGLDYRKVAVNNTTDIALVKTSNPPIHRITANVKVAVPVGYVVIIWGETTPIGWRVLTGVVDSGYRGDLGFIVAPTDDYARSEATAPNLIFEAGSLSVRLSVLRLVPDEELKRCGSGAYRLPLVPTGQSFKCEEAYLGAGFEKAIAAVREVHPDCPYSILRCLAAFGCTGCRAFLRRSAVELYVRNPDDPVVLRDKITVAGVDRFSAGDDVKFVVVYRDMVIAGLADCPPRSSELVTIELREDPSAAASLVPFLDTFSEKREEDAGYDIRTPAMVAFEPGQTFRFVIRQKLSLGQNRAACVLGRSSMNSRGLVVAPTRIPDGEWCAFTITNASDSRMLVEANERVAQLVVMERDNCGPHVSSFALPYVEAAKDALDWHRVDSVVKHAPASARGESGFGSTGRFGSVIRAE